MAEEETPSAPLAEPTTGTEKSDSKPENGKGRKNREDHVPVEELFDLSKPIPHVSGLLVHHKNAVFVEEIVFPQINKFGTART